MNIDEVILLNQIAQGIRTIQEGKDWFLSLSVERRLEVLRHVSFLALQASAREEDVPLAIERSGLRRGYTPCVLLLNGRLKIQLAKVCALPPEEYEKAFILLITLLGIADSRRRTTKCVDGCDHWWHRDLSDEDVLNDIRKNPT